MACAHRPILLRLSPPCEGGERDGPRAGDDGAQQVPLLQKLKNESVNPNFSPPQPGGAVILPTRPEGRSAQFSMLFWQTEHRCSRHRVRGSRIVEPAERLRCVT